MKTLAFRAAASLAAMTVISGFTATPAMACQGVQFETSMVFLSDTKFEDVPEGMVQYRVLIQKSALRDIYSRDFLTVYVRDMETGERLSRENGGQTLGIVIPVGTSCHNPVIPEPGQYYVVGTLAEKAGGGPVVVRGKNVFYPRFKGVPTMSRLLDGAIMSGSEE